VNWKKGFKRAFVLLAILYMIPVILFFYGTIPTAEQYQRNRIFDTVILIKDYNPQVFPESAWTYEIANGIVEEGAEDWLLKVHQKFGGQIDFSQIEQDYKEQMKELGHNQYKTVFTIFLVWAIPLVVVYLFGVGIGWVFAGFKTS
jgi:hypothetical protein